MWGNRELKILVVDDDEDLRKIAVLTLMADTEVECTVLEAASGSEAIQIARAEQPDVILMDQIMPGMDGLKTVEHLRAEEATRDIPVIFVTATETRRDCRSYAAAGAAGIILKPYEPIALARNIVAILDDPDHTTEIRRESDNAPLWPNEAAIR